MKGRTTPQLRPLDLSLVFSLNPRQDSKDELGKRLDLFVLPNMDTQNYLFLCFSLLLDSLIDCHYWGWEAELTTLLGHPELGFDPKILVMSL